MRLSLAYLLVGFLFSPVVACREIQPIIRGRRGDDWTYVWADQRRATVQPAAPDHEQMLVNSAFCGVRIRHERGLDATPLASNGVIYITGVEHAYALDAKTRRNSGTFDPKVPLPARFILLRCRESWPCPIPRQSLSRHTRRGRLNRTRYKKPASRLGSGHRRSSKS